MSNFIKCDSKDAEFRRIPLTLSCCYLVDGMKYFVADEKYHCYTEYDCTVDKEWKRVRKYKIKFVRVDCVFYPKQTRSDVAYTGVSTPASI